MFDVQNLGSGYGDVQILSDLSFEVGNEILAVLGANGAGKTTLLSTLAKVVPVREGSIAWQGQDVSATPAYELSKRGIAYVPQEGNVFPNLSVAENLSLGALVGTRSKQERLDEVYALFPRLAERKDQTAGSLSGGEGQMLAVGRALMQDPQLLLLDEPSAGLSPLYVDILFENIAQARKSRNISIILAEQNAKKTLEIADRVLVLSLGRMHLLEPAKGLSMKRLMKAYHI
ncbi:ABC transporter ATP-binding protein [Yoonia sp. BS5-3]|uniref:ABC transporter ATP-binding protein n=1 Tax=Yoonia phaeophyticola TaxID=3137369 RepID=A0ABZ2V6F7_9RHOB